MSSSLGNFNYSNASDGFVQQTFLGASIIDFSISAGFGDDSSSISVNLINDEYNSGDAQGLGLGDDVYHNGKNDAFVPPIMGSPVYFKFGTAHATVEQAFRKTVDDIYGYNTSKNNPGHFHFAFGGVLQAINETRDTGGNPKFSANVVDPREVLANVQLILNNYAGSTFNNKNMYNIYGFLEYDLPENFSPPFKNADPLTKRTFENGTSIYYGTDTYSDKPDGEIQDTLGPTANSFPMTGQGFSRRGSQGIPYYRVAQGLSALMELSQPLPPIYKNAGFGGYINFRGYNYVVDLSGLPVLDKFYYLDFDKLTLLDLIQEICEVANHDFIVTLLPIINHPSMLHLYKYNQGKIAAQEMDKTIAGIIRIETIDRSVAQPPGSVISYINSLESRGVEVTKKNIGLELSNINTDKFVVGGNEVEMYYFTADADRLPEDDRLQWDLDKSLEQQILPYYGKLPGSALLPSTVSITKGFGSYQQILLDAGGLSAFGVGNYYVATEIELRAAMVSFERWTQFLLQYDNVYMESVEPNDVEEGMQLQTQLPADHPGVQNPLISNNYAVTVPRSVWPSDEPGYDIAGLPLSPCNPPYGYPLYWKRATQIGIPTSAATKVGNAANNIVKKVADATGKTLQQIQNPNGIEARGVDQTINPQLNSNINFNPSTSNFFSVASIDEANQLKKIADERIDRIISDVSLAKLSETIQFNSRVNRKSLSNAKKIHSWLKSIADECLGKKFLVKIPRQVNLFYDKEITQFTNQFGEKHIYKGPFGFVPREVTSDTEANLDFSMKESALVENKYTTRTYLNSDESLLQPEDNYVGALKVNFNPIADKYEFNYKPEPQGGFWEYDLQFNFSANNEPLHVSQAIAPQDPTIFDLGNSRISAYVRFDNSQDLSFNGFSSDSIAQQSAQAGHFVPDLNYTLDNLSPGKPKDLPPQDTPKAKQVTFVKVTLDQNFYMAPKTSYVPVAVHGRVINQEFTLSAPREMLSPSGCDMVKATQYTEMVASPAPTTDGYSSTIKHFAGSYRYGQIQYEPDTDHVYALITLPNRVVPTVDSRLRDGQLQTYNTAQLKHFLAVDVVKGVDGFQVPNIAGTPTDLTGDFLLQPLGKDATAAVTKAREMVSFALPNKIEFCTPSPVYPDMVALPLMSTERCYGPWMSSQIGANLDIGGKVDYIKDENLTPWNFSGYELMNKSALIQAEFSNSLLLSSERGSFSIPTAPSGISIGKGLLNKGPLVTNMNVSVSTNGVTTDYQLDLYTPSFGKLKKQRLGAIAKIARTQQKLEDEKNALIRRGMSKNQSDVSLQVVYNNMLQQINNIQVNQPSLAQKDQASNPNQLVQTIIPQKTSEQTSDGSNSARHRHVAASTTDSKSIEAGGEIMQTDQNQLNASYHNTAASDTSRTLAAVSLEPGHNDMVSAEMPPHEAIKYLLESEDGLTNVSINRKPPEGAT